MSSFSSISPTTTLLRSPNASSPHLVSGSLLLPPFTRRSVRNSVEKIFFFSIFFQKLAKRRARSVIRLHAQVISSVVESVFPVSLPPRARAGPRRACNGRNGLRLIWPTFGKSRKTTKSDPSAGDQFCESRRTAKFDAPVGLLGRVSRTGSNYDSPEEAQWPCASFCQFSENRGKRQSPILL